MSLSPRTVLIPIVGRHDGDGRIVRILADGTSPLMSYAGLNPQISGLLDWQLYEAGAIALGAVKRLRLPPSRLTFLRRSADRALGGTLNVTNGPDIVGLSDDHNKSAELGLALALIMYAAQSRDVAVIATGHLARAADPASLVADAVDVLPVEGLKQKFQALGRSLDQAGQMVSSSRILFFLPAKTDAGEPVISCLDTEIAALKRDFESHGIELVVCPVRNLHEAAARLGILRLRTTTVERFAAALIFSGALTTAIAFAVYLMLGAPIGLAFDTVMSPAGEIVPTPARAIFDPKGKAYVLREPCIDTRKLPVYPAGEWMIVRALIAKRGWMASWLGGYHYALVAVSEKSGFKVFPPETFRKQPIAAGSATRDGTDERFDVVLPVRGPSEENKLILLAKRGLPFSVEALRHGLQQTRATAPSGSTVNAAVTYLSSVAPGYLDYSFLSSEKDGECKE